MSGETPLLGKQCLLHGHEDLSLDSLACFCEPVTPVLRCQRQGNPWGSLDRQLSQITVSSGFNEETFSQGRWQRAMEEDTWWPSLAPACTCTHTHIETKLHLVYYSDIFLSSGRIYSDLTNNAIQVQNRNSSKIKILPSFHWQSHHWLRRKLTHGRWNASRLT